MTLEQINIILDCLGRVQIQGSEAPKFLDAVNALQEFAQENADPKPNKPDEE